MEEHVLASDDRRQHDEEARAVVIVFEDRPPVIAPRGDVVDPAGELESERPGHAPTLPLRPLRAQVCLLRHTFDAAYVVMQDLTPYFFIAAMRRFSCSMLTSSLWVARCQLWPRGSLRVPERSP